MAEIQVISTTKIQARSNVNNGDSPKKIELNPWDLRFLLLEYAQKGLLFHKPTISSSIVIQHLKESLSCTLNFFMPLAGRLAMVSHDEDDTSSIFVTCNNAGASFVHAIAENTTMVDILEPIYVPPFVESFFPLAKTKNFEGTHIPLMAVQVTELVDGIFIAFAINHCLVDVMPFGDFVNTWAKINRNGLHHIGSNSKIVSLERWFPHGNIERPIRIPFRDIMEDYVDEYVKSLYPPPISRRIFHFKREKIAELKAKAKLEVEDGVLSNKISSLQAVISHVWRCAIKNNARLDLEEEVHCSILVTAKSRISNPPIPDNYFGNTVQFAHVTMKVRDLVGDKGHGKFAFEINKAVSLYTEEKIKRDFEALIPNPTLPLLSGKFGKVLHTGGSHRSNLNTVDFGWGTPLGLRRGPSYMNDWDLVVDAGSEEESLDIELCLSHEILELMGRDPEFMHSVSPPPPLPTGLSNKLARGRL